ncbi:hypothetical protein GE061_014902 [Apolygus lucorum]|uniref:DUF4794 domain-containing protein n=1 Tax=Apolygus lucorum TaxID=248454 RepID=A0A8S9XLP7_APOLU|nr:hypothetical protein GE061_014902 [Apolygus lucorum]
MKWTSVAVLCVLGALCELGAVDGLPREKRTIGFIFRGLVDAAANQAAARYEARQQQTAPPARPIEYTTPAPIEQIRQPPRPMIYIIPVSNRSPQANEISNLAEVLRTIKAPMKIKSENGSVDPDLKELIQATKHLTIDKRNASYKPEDEDKSKLEEAPPEASEKPPKKQFSIKIQAPKEVNSEKQFTIKIVGDDVVVKKTKEGYNVKFTLPDTSANIRIEYPQQMFEKQELRAQPQYGGPYGPGGAYSPFPGYPGFGGYGPYGSPYGGGYTPTTAQQGPYGGGYAPTTSQQGPGQPHDGKDVETINPGGRYTPTAAQQPPYAYQGGHPFAPNFPGYDPYRSYASGFTSDPYNYRANPAANTRTPYADPYGGQQQQQQPFGGFDNLFPPFPGAGQDYNGIARNGQNGNYDAALAPSGHVPCAIQPHDRSSFDSAHLSNCTAFP